MRTHTCAHTHAHTHTHPSLPQQPIPLPPPFLFKPTKSNLSSLKMTFARLKTPSFLQINKEMMHPIMENTPTTKIKALKILSLPS